MRIGNIEFRTTSCIGRDETYDEIVLWYKNSSYGSEDRMKKEGWTFDENGDAHFENCHIDSGIFKSKEMCYTIAFIDWNNAHDEYDIRSVGRRAFELNEKDHDDFMKILDYIDQRELY